MKRIWDVKLTFLTPLLGTTPLDSEVYSAYVAARNPTEEGRDEENQIKSEQQVADELERRSTGFMRLPDGSIYLYDYQVRGFFKGAAYGCRRASDSKSAKLKAYKTAVDAAVFVTPRVLVIRMPSGGEVTWLERPLRADTAQGPRICLARSEQAPDGSAVSFRVISIDDKIDGDILREWLDYGEFHGLGQWRGGGWGRFSYTITDQTPAE